MRELAVEPKLSIITITYNDKGGLARTLSNIAPLIAIHDDVEHVVIDGGSSYDVHGLVTALSPKSKILSERDRGIYHAMNKGIALSHGRFLNFINSGDEFIWESLFATIDLSTCDYEFIYGDSFESTEGGDETKTASHHSGVKMGMFTHHQAMIFRRVFLEEHRIRHDESLRIAGDWDVVIRVLQNDPRVLYVPMPICLFEGGGVSQIQIDISRNEVFALRWKYFGLGIAVWRQLLQDAVKLLRRVSPKSYWLVRNRYSRATHQRNS